MAQALQLAERGLCTTHPNPRVGCVIVNQGQIVGQGWHQRAGEPHAEIHALREAGAQARQATVYVTLEPCCHYGRTPPCTLALIQAQVARVVIAMPDPNPVVAGKGIAELQAAGIAVAVGLLAEQARQLNRGFIQRMQQQRPWVRCKLAMSLDGRTAMASGESQWITSPEARIDAHRWRARSSGIMTSISTVLADDPALTVRLPAAEAQRLAWAAYGQPPLRIVLDAALKMPPACRLTREPGRIIVITCNTDPNQQAALIKQGIEIAVIPANPHQPQHLDLKAVLAYLAQQQAMNEILLEAGATLNGALLQAGLIDELIIYMAPHLLGHQARGLFHLPGLDQLAQRIPLTIQEISAIGPDWRILAQPMAV